MEVILLFKKKHINVRSKLFSLPFTFIVQLVLRTPNHKSEFKYKFTAIVLGIAPHILFKHVGIKKDEIDKRFFLNLLFANKSIDGINLYPSSQISHI